jgi:hypothetical protein
MPRDERAPSVALDGVDAARIVGAGKLRILGLLPRSSNYTFLARVAGDGGELLVVYKPRAGETPLWDFPEGTLGLREVAAYRVARALGWPRVPLTLYRDGPEGPGSVQLFVEFDPAQHYFTLLERYAETFRRTALFDALVNNADRKGGHCLLAADGEVFAIDHGVCFSSVPKLRTVIWEFAGDAIAPESLRDLRRVEAALAEGGALRRDLEPLLRPEEIEATRRRARSLIASGRYPQPGEDRPFPWPAI